ncbi:MULTISPECIES: hypothetical protein [Nonomuraea]|uniref:hypothetical protein n=1 Tax=Nonomuraea TaxID=83681 RepID=UPI0012FB31E0|nr:hypothetical protein [Nonomuraea typhae]
MAVSRKSPTDLTGRKAAELAEERAEELKARAGEITTLTGIPQEVDDEEIVVADAVEVDVPTRKIRVLEDLEDICVGVGTSYTFLRGKTYTVPAHVAAHLEEKGYTWLN